MARKSKGRRRSIRKQKQRGGSEYTGGNGAYSFTGAAGISAGGVPFDSRAASNYNCGWDLRHAPMVREVGAMRGGRRSRRQRGGSCGCGAGLQRGGNGGGSGGHGTAFPIDSSSKLYPDVFNYPCLPTPKASDLGTVPLYQQGGEASYRDAAEIVSYPSGWGVGPAGVVSTDSAHYVDPLRYGRHCMGGARRTSKNVKGRRRRQ